MENDELQQELVERYLDGLMTEQEVEDFETQLLRDEALSEALEDERLVRAAVQRARAQELRGKMQQWRQEKSQTHAKRKWIILSMTAVLAIVALYFALKYLSPASKPMPPVAPNPPTITDTIPSPSAPPSGTETKKSDNPIVDNRPAKTPAKGSNNSLAQTIELFARSKYIAPRKVADSKTKGNSTPDNFRANAENPQAKAKESLENAHYATALKWLEQADSSNAEVRNLTAEALFGVGRYDEAALKLQSLLNDTRFQIDAHRNLVLCYLAQYPQRQDDYKKAIASLRNIGSDNLNNWADSLQIQTKR